MEKRNDKEQSRILAFFGSDTPGSPAVSPIATIPERLGKDLMINSWEYGSDPSPVVGRFTFWAEGLLRAISAAQDICAAKESAQTRNRIFTGAYRIFSGKNPPGRGKPPAGGKDPCHFPR